jgi:ubiquinone/menaquinone biosynthesis C-methylase UbiE
VGADFFSYFGEELIERIDLGTADKLLDVACGTGAVLIPAAKRVGRAGITVGVDLSKEMLRRARQVLVELDGCPASVLRMDAQHLGFMPASFDVIIVGFALDSFPAPDLALRECARVARSGGRLGLTIANRWWWEGDDRWYWHGALLRSLGVHVAEGRFRTPEAIEAAIREAGWWGIAIESERFEFTFTDADEWWKWAWSHGYRQILERMMPVQLRRYRAECLAQLRRHGADIGARLDVFVVTATKPA